MRKINFLLKRCDLLKCEKRAHYRLDDGRYICEMHAGLLFGSDMRIRAIRDFEKGKEFDLDLSSKPTTKQ